MSFEQYVNALYFAKQIKIVYVVSRETFLHNKLKNNVPRETFYFAKIINVSRGTHKIGENYMVK